MDLGNINALSNNALVKGFAPQKNFSQKWNYDSSSVLHDRHNPLLGIYTKLFSCCM